MGDPSTCFFKQIMGTCPCEEAEVGPMHFQASLVVPETEPGWALCDKMNDTLTAGKLTSDKKAVTCQECKEILFS